MLRPSSINLVSLPLLFLSRYMKVIMTPSSIILLSLLFSWNCLIICYRFVFTHIILPVICSISSYKHTAHSHWPCFEDYCRWHLQGACGCWSIISVAMGNYTDLSVIAKSTTSNSALMQREHRFLSCHQHRSTCKCMLMWPFQSWITLAQWKPTHANTNTGDPTPSTGRVRDPRVTRTRLTPLFILMLISLGVGHRHTTGNEKISFPSTKRSIIFHEDFNSKNESRFLHACGFREIFCREFKTTTNEQFSLIEGGIPEGPRQSSLHAKSDSTWQAGGRAVIWLIMPD